MSTSAQRRLLKDLKRIQNQPGDEIIASPLTNNLLRWTATIEGIEQTPWEGGLFQLKLQFTENYPNKPPFVKFTSEMFHPNIYNDGRICLDMLQNQWSPVYDVWSILTAIRSLLADPNTLSPANMVASNIFKDNKILYEQKVREIVEKSLDCAADEDEELKETPNNRPQEEPQNVVELTRPASDPQVNQERWGDFSFQQLPTLAMNRVRVRQPNRQGQQIIHTGHHIFALPFHNRRINPPTHVEHDEQEDSDSSELDEVEVIVADADADADADVDESLVEYDELESEGDEDEEQAGDPNNLNEEDFS